MPNVLRMGAHGVPPRHPWVGHVAAFGSHGPRDVGGRLGGGGLAWLVLKLRALLNHPILAWLISEVPLGFLDTEGRGDQAGVCRALLCAQRQPRLRRVL